MSASGDDERTILRATFDQDAALYHRARPGYPAALIEDVITLTGLPAQGSILEIGCGTGIATLPFARRGYSVLGIELGENMASVARHTLAAYPQAQVWTGAFEDWDAPEAAFDLCLSATAFHWIDPAVAWPKIGRTLRAGGGLALFWNKHVQSAGGQAFYDAMQEVYRTEAPEIFKDEPLLTADEVEEPATALLAASRLFGPVTVRRYVWEQVYDADSYLDVLNTYSGHRHLRLEGRTRLFEALRRLIDTRFDGQVRKGYASLLYVARKR